MKEMLGGCCVCADENGWTDNPLIYCDGENCEVAVHQGCYGIQEVPEGEWFCAKCSASSSGTYTNGSTNGSSEKSNGTVKRESFRCELCPSSYGALKKTDKNGWAHVICALYIPEVRFGDVHSMDPVILSDVPPDRFEKLCYICDAQGSRSDAKCGACMSCNKPGCKRGFHVTCAQQKGLLCEEGGASKNVKYCGYCESHLRKAQQDPSIKVIPACRITRLPQSPPPSSNHSAQHMLVDHLPRPEQVNNALFPSSSLDGPTSSHLATAFSPPLTSSSRSSVALDATPPLAAGHPPSAQATSSEGATVGAHLQQFHHPMVDGPNFAPNAQSNFNSIVSAMGQQAELTNHNRLAGLSASDLHAHLNGDLEQKTVKAVLTAPLTSAANKGKRIRDVKSEVLANSVEKAKRPRANNRTSATATSVASAKNASMQRLISLVAPVVSETVSDFQRDRVADRNAAERRAAGLPAVAPTTSSSSCEILPSTAANVVANAAVAPPNVIASHSVTNGQPSVGRHTNSTLPSSMEQLLERQWEQGSQFLMSQAHFDVAQLLSCLHQLKSENVRLEDQLALLTKRREHLMALNQRLSQPLGPPLPTPQHATSASTSTAHPPAAPVAASVSSSNATTSTHSTQPSITSPHHSPKMSHQPPPVSTSQHLPPTSTTIVNDESLHQLRSLAASGAVRPIPVSVATTQPTTPVTRVPAHVPSSGAFIAAHQNSTSIHQRATGTPAIASVSSTPIVTPPTTSVASASLANQLSAADLSPERLAQLANLANAPLGGLYRNQLLNPTINGIDPALLILLQNPNYLSNPSLFSRFVSGNLQPHLAAAAALVGTSPQHPAASNGK